MKPVLLDIVMPSFEETVLGIIEDSLPRIILLLALLLLAAAVVFGILVINRNRRKKDQQQEKDEKMPWDRL